MLGGEFEKLLNKNIKIKSLYPKSYNEYNKFKKLLISLRILFFKNSIYKKYIKNNYDVEVAFLEGPITNILSSKNKNTKKIAWIHSDISLIFGNNLKSKVKKIINKKVYKKYQELVFVSNNNLQEFNKLYNITVNKQVINNYLNKENVLKLCKEFNVDLFEQNTINFVTVARLVEAKAIDRLINVHSKLITTGYNHNFFVIGDGPLKEVLQNKITELNLSKTFILLGQKENPYPYILNSDYFCLFSHYEGLPMVLLEAKVLNKFILITDNSSKEALEDYENKKIFENNENGIYNGLKEIIENNKNIKIINNNFNSINIEIINKIKNLLGD
jgi:glycosyltransferase involved in cell wall biosynthesis